MRGLALTLWFFLGGVAVTLVFGYAFATTGLWVGLWAAVPLLLVYYGGLLKLANRWAEGSR